MLKQMLEADEDHLVSVLGRLVCSNSEGRTRVPDVPPTPQLSSGSARDRGDSVAHGARGPRCQPVPQLAPLNRRAVREQGHDAWLQAPRIASLRSAAVASAVAIERATSPRTRIVTQVPISSRMASVTPPCSVRTNTSSPDVGSTTWKPSEDTAWTLSRRRPRCKGARWEHVANLGSHLLPAANHRWPRYPPAGTGEDHRR